MMSLSSSFNNLAYFLPNCCLLCGLNTTLQRPICLACIADLPWLGNACPQCGLPLEADGVSRTGTPCGQCLSSPPVYDHCYAPLCYAPPVDYLIRGFKYRSNFTQGGLLTGLLIEHLKHSYSDQPWPQSIIPVPLHWRRRLFRGFNQAEVLGHDLAKALPLALDSHSCRRIHATAHQRGQSRSERKHNLRNAFRLNGLFTEMHIAVLDDVVTTGSTVAEISRLLKRAGAARIDIWALARTPSPQPPDSLDHRTKLSDN